MMFDIKTDLSSNIIILKNTINLTPTDHLCTLIKIIYAHKTTEIIFAY